MTYSKEAAKWKAYQFSDPFATNAFLVCNKATQTFCRPDCDRRPKTNLKNEVTYVEFSDDALKMGFSPCKLCDPMNKPLIDVELLTKCVEVINEKIGFTKPLTDENEDLNNDKIKENILILKKSNCENILNVIDSNISDKRQVLSDVKSMEISPNYIDSISLTKNDSDHYRLVDLACRHLAYAAAINLFFPQKYLEDDLNITVSRDGKKKRRRGGVLGFKELAAKSKLSAWHFHRVFKSVTGLTPKTYGDKCNDFLEKYKDSKFINYSRFNRNITPVSSSEGSVDYNSPPFKRQKVDKNDSPVEDQIQMSLQTPKSQLLERVSMPQMQNYTSLGEYNIPEFDIEHNEFDRSSSVPDLTKYEFSLMQPANIPIEKYYDTPVEAGNELQDMNIQSYTQSPLKMSLSSTNTEGSPFEAPSLFNHYNVGDDEFSKPHGSLSGLNSYNPMFNFAYDNVDMMKPIDNFDLPIEEFNDINDFITTGI